MNPYARIERRMRALIVSIGLAIGACRRQWVNVRDRALWLCRPTGAISMHTSRSILHVKLKERTPVFGLYKWIIYVEQADSDRNVN